MSEEEIVLSEGDILSEDGKVVGRWSQCVKKKFLVENAAKIKADVAGKDDWGYKQFYDKVKDVVEAAIVG